MGLCCCRQFRNDRDSSSSTSASTGQSNLGNLYSSPFNSISSTRIKDLIIETLTEIRTIVNVDQDPPIGLRKLHKIASNERGWLEIIRAMIAVIPANDPLRPSLISLLIDGFPLPTRESINKLPTILDINNLKQQKKHGNENICIILACLAEKLAGCRSIALLTDDVLEFLLENLKLTDYSHSQLIIFSLLALEKFAQTSENKLTINDRLAKLSENPLLTFEKWSSDKDYGRKQIAFIAQWLLDNIFLIPGRKLTYETIDLSNINALLNVNDVSEYLKISSDGLAARSDSSSFESVRCTFQVTSGIWYYEVTLITSGIMQIGFATKDSQFMTHDGLGIGDDEYSIAYDGCRKLIWYNALSYPQEHPPWKPGDTLGCLLDLESKCVIFSLNGHCLPANKLLFKTAKGAFYAAASFLSNQQCRFNFGATSFKYPPVNIDYKCFNEFTSLKANEKIVFPK